ncbi:hypothetical protein [Streptomyces sp. NPDC059247]
MRSTGCRPSPRSPTPMYLYEEKHPMNVITNLLAGVFHFLGWLV